MSLEDRVRAAAEATAASVRDAPSLPRPADQPGRAPSRLRPRRRRRPRPQRGWLIPLAAAAAVVILAVALVAVRTVSGGDRGAEQPSSPAPTGLAAVPKYYAAVTDGTSGGGQDLTVAETATGRALFTVKAPQDGAARDEGIEFGTVTAAADDRTFAVSLVAYDTNPSANFKALNVIGWELLRLNPGDSGYTLQRLSVPGLATGTVATSALSPDGTRLAVLSYQQPAQPSANNQVSLRVYAVTTGQVLRAYTAVGEVYGVDDSTTGNPANSLTWLADGSGLTFAWGTVKTTKSGTPSQVTQQVREVYLARPSGNLLAASSGYISVSSVTGTCAALVPAANGQGAGCGTQTYQGPGIPGRSEQCQAAPAPLTYRYYSGPAGAYRVLATVPFGPRVSGACQIGGVLPLWVSPAGTTMIGVTIMEYLYSATAPGPTPASTFTPLSTVGIAAGGRWTPLPAAVQQPAGSLVLSWAF